MSVARISIALVAMLTLAACADDGSASQGSGELEGVTWILDADIADDLVGEPSGEARGTIRFDDGELGGSAFCNMFGGTYEAGDDGSMTLTLGAMTEMACEEPAMSLETAFVEALGAVTGYEVGDDTLTLIRDGGDALTFSAEQPLPLVATEWRLDGIATGTDAVTSTLAGTEATATFDGEGRVSGNGSCNQYGASYSVDGDSIEIGGDVMSTAMGCEPDVMDQEAAFLSALQRSATFSIEGSTLTLSDDEGVFLLSFVAA